MTDNNLKVKFRWQLRKRVTDEEDTCRPTKPPGKSRSATHMRNKKDTDSNEYGKHLVKDARRKRESYVSIKDRSTEDQQQQRKEWADKKEIQRRKKKECQWYSK